MNYLRKLCQILKTSAIDYLRECSPTAETADLKSVQCGFDSRCSYHSWYAIRNSHIIFIWKDNQLISYQLSEKFKRLKNVKDFHSRNHM